MHIVQLILMCQDYLRCEVMMNYETLAYLIMSFLSVTENVYRV